MMSQTRKRRNKQLTWTATVSLWQLRQTVGKTFGRKESFHSFVWLPVYRLLWSILTKPYFSIATVCDQEASVCAIVLLCIRMSSRTWKHWQQVMSKPACVSNVTKRFLLQHPSSKQQKTKKQKGQNCWSNYVSAMECPLSTATPPFN